MAAWSFHQNQDDSWCLPYYHKHQSTAQVPKCHHGTVDPSVRGIYTIWWRRTWSTWAVASLQSDHSKSTKLYKEHQTMFLKHLATQLQMLVPTYISKEKDAGVLDGKKYGSERETHMNDEWIYAIYVCICVKKIYIYTYIYTCVHPLFDVPPRFQKQLTDLLTSSDHEWSSQLMSNQLLSLKHLWNHRFWRQRFPGWKRCPSNFPNDLPHWPSKPNRTTPCSHPVGAAAA